MRFTLLLLASIGLILLACSGDLPGQVDPNTGNDNSDNVASLPTDTPAAKLSAIPTATPVAKPTATHVAKPAVISTPIPVAKPAAIPTPIPVAKPTAIPTATPVIEQAPSATITPVPESTPIPTTVPVTELTPVTDVSPAYSFLTGSISVKLTNDSTGKSKDFGTSVAIDKDRMIVGDSKEYSEGTDSGSASIYSLSNDTWVLQTQITADDIYQGYQFGGAVDIDGVTAVVGAIGGAKGAVYVFVLEDDTWVQQAKLIDIPTDSSAQFGSSVAISGNTIVVGAPADDAPETDSGSVFVFTRSDGVWTKTAQLSPSGRIYTLANNRFGESVSIYDDRIYIGASGDWTTNGTDSGVVYVFAYSESTWIEEQRLTASDGSEGDKFGKSLSVFNDTLVVGAPYYDGNGTDSGATYVFIRDIAAEWSEEIKLIASDGASSDNFGWTVGVGEDLAIVGALYSDAPSSDSGSVYTYERTGTNWIEQSKLIGTDSASGDRFGTSVSISGELAVVGSPGHMVASKEIGAIHVFTAAQR